MSSGSSLWRLYPKRSIASHSICGSGRLFPGLERETRGAESMTWVVTEQMVAKNNEQPERGKGYSKPVRLSREYCKNSTKGEAIRKNCGLHWSNSQG